MQLVLLGVPFLDELGSGLPVVGAPALQAELLTSFAGLSLAVFTVPQLAALVLDPPALLFASRFRRPQAIAAGLWIYALALGFAPASRSVWAFALAWTVTSIATGVVCAAAQAELIEQSRGREERAMAEWTLGSALGDLAGPLLLAAVAATGRSGREGWLVAAAIFVAWGSFAWRAPRRPSFAHASATPAPTDPVEAHDHTEARDDAPLAWAALFRRARETPALLGWLLAATLCSLMDETLVALCALWMKHRFAHDSAVTLAVLSLMLGGLLGLVVLHRASERVAPGRFLLLACAGSTVALGAWLAAPSLPLALAATFALGACAATHYPLAQAAAYRCLPSSATTVAALAQFFGPVDLLIPLALGALADRYGLHVALSGLLIQPLALLLATVPSTSRGASRRPR